MPSLAGPLLCGPISDTPEGLITKIALFAGLVFGIGTEIASPPSEGKLHSRLREAPTLSHERLPPDLFKTISRRHTKFV